MSEKKVLLELRGVKTFFPVRGGFFNKVRDHVQAVNDVDLDIYKGETLGLVGESGCGKTTLGKSIIQLVKATDGTMMYDFGPQHGGICRRRIRPFLTKRHFDSPICAVRTGPHCWRGKRLRCWNCALPTAPSQRVCPPRR